MGSWDTLNKSGRATRQAIHIQSILEDFKNHVLKSLNVKSENELWLEKISQIPKDEF